MSEKKKLEVIRDILRTFRQGLQTDNDPFPWTIHSKNNRVVEFTMPRRKVEYGVVALHKQYMSILQQTCSHPLWYFVDNIEEPLTNIHWKCQCLNCGTTKIDRPKTFMGRVVLANIYFEYGERSKRNYLKTLMEYQLLKGNIPEDEINSYMIKKYSLAPTSIKKSTM